MSHYCKFWFLFPFMHWHSICDFIFAFVWQLIILNIYNMQMIGGERISVINTLILIDTISYQYLQKLLFAPLCAHRFPWLKAALQKRTGKREVKTVLDHMRKSDQRRSIVVWPGQPVRKGGLRRVYKKLVQSIY